MILISSVIYVITFRILIYQETMQLHQSMSQDAFNDFISVLKIPLLVDFESDISC